MSFAGKKYLDLVNIYLTIWKIFLFSSPPPQKCDAPVEEVEITVEGMILNEDSVELYTDTECLKVPKDMLQAALSKEGEVDLESLCSNEAIRIQVKRCGSEVLSVLLL